MSWIAPLFHLILALLKSSASVQQNDFVEVVSSPDMTCSGSNVLFTSYRATKIRCGISCVNDINCTGYTYRKLDDKCVGCQGTDRVVSSIEPGMKYYVPMNRVWGMECTSDVSCGGGNQQCLDGVCVCMPGYSFLKSTWSCVDNCASYGNTFQRYPGYRIKGNHYVNERGLTSEECLIECLSVSGCVTVDFADGPTWDSWCLMQNVTAMDVPAFYEQFSSYDHYNRNCE